MGEESKVIDAEPLTPETKALDIRDASNSAVALMEQRVANQKKMLKIAISLTGKHQWVMFGESVYPCGGASDTVLRRAFGLTWGEKEITIEETPEGKMATCKAYLMQNGQPIEAFTGYRFQEGFIKNEADLRKGAIENMKSVAVRDILGLRARTAGELKELGLDVSKLEKRVDFQEHEKDSDSAVVTFGKNKGTRLTDLSDGDLAWHGKAARESVDDPSKSRWKKKNTEWLKACFAEHKRRNPPAEKPAEETTSSVAPESGHAGAVAGSSEPQASGATEPPHDPETGEVTEVGGQPVLCAQPGCDSPATHGVYCGGHLPSQKGQGSLDMREPGEEG